MMKNWHSILCPHCNARVKVRVAGATDTGSPVLDVDADRHEESVTPDERPLVLLGNGEFTTEINESDVVCDAT